MDQRESRFHLYSETTTLSIGAEEYSNEYDFVRRGEQLVKNSTIWFISCLGISGLAFLLGLTAYLCKFRSKDREAAVYHQVDETDR